MRQTYGFSHRPPIADYYFPFNIMNIGTLLQNYTTRLHEAGIGSPQLDILILLEDLTSKDRGWLLAHPEFELTSSQYHRLNDSLSRREKHEPLAYIRQKTEFYDRNFYVDKNVLEPRPETETMIEMLKKYVTKNSAIADIGTGSGAIAVTAKLEFSSTRVIATDIDNKCLTVANKNAKLHKVNIKFFHGDLLTPLISTLATIHYPLIILANLPYVPDSFTLNSSADIEPKKAIFGGSDGLNLYRRLFKQIPRLKNSPALIFTESLPPQHADLAKIAENASYHLIETQDFIQAFQTSG